MMAKIRFRITMMKLKIKNLYLRVLLKKQQRQFYKAIDILAEELQHE